MGLLETLSNTSPKVLGYVVAILAIGLWLFYDRVFGTGGPSSDATSDDRPPRRRLPLE